MSFQSNNEVFYNDGYQLVKSSFDDKPNKEKIFKALSQMYDSIDMLIESLLNLAAKQGVNVACHKGCGWCCHQAVFANSYEVHFLSEYIKEKFSTEERKEIHERARQKNEKVKELSEEKALSYKSACPLLVDGACSAYKARPMACRIYLSTKLESCLEYYHHPENEKNYPALLDFPLQAGKMMNEGFMAALLEYNIGTAEFRLEEGLFVALDESWQEPIALK